MTLNEALAERLRQLLRERQWSQAQLAARLQCSPAAITYLLKSKRHQETLSFYVRIADVIGMPLSQLIAHLETRAGEMPAQAPLHESARHLQRQKRAPGKETARVLETLATTYELHERLTRLLHGLPQQLP